MAIKCNSKTAIGNVAVPDAYHRVVHVINSRLRGDSVVLVDVSTSAAEQPFKQETYFFPYDQNLTVANAYTQLKTLPEFAGAVDV